MDLKEIFGKICLIRYFELQLIEAVKKKLIPGPVYLSVGQEAISAVVSTLTKGYAIFGQHRAHSVYLAYGGDIERLIDELLGLQTGCCRGRGGSPCIQDLNIKMHGHHGLIGENIPLAVGYALATKEKTVAYFGDAAAEEDYSLSSMGFAITHKLPVLFVCENNNLSILTPIKERRSWNISEAAKSMGLATAVVEDEPELIFESAEKLISSLPAYLEVKTNRHRWHTGIGVVQPMVLSSKRLNLFQDNLMLFFTGLSRNASDIAVEQIKNTSQKTQELKIMLEMVDEAVNILSGDFSLDDFGKLLNESWKIKRSLTSQITNSRVDEIYEAGLKAGASGGKLLGAGGGGFILFFVKPELQKKVREVLKDLLYVPFKFENSGSQIIYYAPNHTF